MSTITWKHVHVPSVVGVSAAVSPATCAYALPQVCIRTYFVVQLWKVNFHFVSLEVMVLGLFTYWRKQVKLACDGVRLLQTDGRLRFL